MTEVGLVSCTKSTRDRPAPPADLYAASTLFSKARQYCETYHDDWYVLSAKHHLMEPYGSAVEPDDKTLTEASDSARRKWAGRICQDLEYAGLLDGETTFVIHAGKAYYEELVPLLDAHDVEVRLPVEGLQIGKRLVWYNDRI